MSLVRNLGEGSSPALPDEAPNCPKHDGWDEWDIPACRPCGRLRERWEADVAEATRLAAIEAAKPKPACPDHPGETAHNCRCCAADRKAVESA